MRNAETPAPAQSRPTAPSRPLEEVARLGDEIYERDIRPQVEAAHHGEVVAIDVDTGDYAIARTALDAADALRERRPALDVWAVRVGYPTLRTFGAVPCEGYRRDERRA